MRHGCSIIYMVQAKRTSTPIPIWSPLSATQPNLSRSAAPTAPVTSAAWLACSNQPLAALNGANYAKPVWHCAVRAAPQDRMLSDSEWAQVAARLMHRIGLAPEGDDLAVRWVAVRHAPDHIHLMATLARQDRIRPKMWNDFYRVREACQEAERHFGLRATAPADRTAARRPTRAESEQTARRRWSEPPRVRLCREVCTAAAGARTEQEFFTRLAEAGVQVRYRHSTTDPSADHRLRRQPPGPHDECWTADLVRRRQARRRPHPAQLRSRWRDPLDPPTGAATLSDHALHALLRETVHEAASHATTESDFFARLRTAGLLVRFRYSDLNPGQVTGYSVTLSGCTSPDGTHRWVGGGRLHDALTLPRLRRTWDGQPHPGDHHGTARFTAQERAWIYEHAVRRAAEATEHLRHCTANDPHEGADAAWAAADALHVAAKAFRSPLLRCVAASYDRASRAPYGRPPHRTHAGESLRAVARLLAMTGSTNGDITTQVLALIANLVTLIEAVAELRAAQTHFTQAAAARETAQQLHVIVADARQRPSGQARAPRSPALVDFPMPIAEVLKAAPPAQDSSRFRPPSPGPPTQAKPRTR